jgi:hypothetical protein
MDDHAKNTNSKGHSRRFQKKQTFSAGKITPEKPEDRK